MPQKKVFEFISISSKMTRHKIVQKVVNTLIEEREYNSGIQSKIYLMANSCLLKDQVVCKNGILILR